MSDLKLVRRPRSPFWIIRGTVAGVRVEESTGVSDEKVARQIFTQRAAEIYKQSVYGRRATVSFAEAAHMYLKLGGEGRFLEKVLTHFGTAPLARIDQDAIDRGALKAYPDAKASTRNRQFYTPTIAVLTFAAKRKWCDAPLIERLEEGPLRVRWLTPAEADRLIDACAPHLRPLVVFLLYTGARVGEALWLDWSCIDLARGHVSLPRTKNGEPRGVGLHPRVVAELANLPHREGVIFRKPDGTIYDPLDEDDPHDTSAGTRISTAFSGAVRRAELTNFHPHDCRHSWATWIYSRTRDLFGLQRLGGWKSLRMVERYAHVNVDELSHLIEALPGGDLGDTVFQMEKSA